MMNNHKNQIDLFFNLIRLYLSKFKILAKLMIIYNLKLLVEYSAVDSFFLVNCKLCLFVETCLWSCERVMTFYSFTLSEVPLTL